MLPFSRDRNVLMHVPSESSRILFPDGRDQRLSAASTNEARWDGSHPVVQEWKAGLLELSRERYFESNQQLYLRPDVPQAGAKVLHPRNRQCNRRCRLRMLFHRMPEQMPENLLGTGAPQDKTNELRGLN